MSKMADDGFGNLVPISSPYGKTTTLFMRNGNNLEKYECETPDHVVAIDAMRKELRDCRLNRFGKWAAGPILALIEGEKL